MKFFKLIPPLLALIFCSTGHTSSDIDKNSVVEIIKEDNLEGLCNMHLTEDDLQDMPLFFPSRCEDISLIDYSAFYGSMKIFNHLLLNGIEPTSQTLNFAIMGETPNISIISELLKQPKLITPMVIFLAFNNLQEDIFSYMCEICENYTKPLKSPKFKTYTTYEYAINSEIGMDKTEYAKKNYPILFKIFPKLNTPKDIEIALSLYQSIKSYYLPLFDEHYFSMNH